MSKSKISRKLKTIDYQRNIFEQYENQSCIKSRIIKKSKITGSSKSFFEKLKSFSGSKWFYFGIPKGRSIGPPIKYVNSDFSSLNEKSQKLSFDEKIKSLW